MRERFPELVEAGRQRSGRYGSLPGGRNGAFVVRHPKSGRDFAVIAGDGRDWAASGLPGPPWDHVSVRCAAGDRLPTWQEMCWLKDLFFGEEECVVQFHPPASRYVNVHPGVLHFWRLADGSFPMPPISCV